MNDKDSLMNKILTIVVECCSSDIGDGTRSVNIENVMGKCREENVVLTRQILSMHLIRAGYTVTSISNILHCTQHNVRKLLACGYHNLKNSMAFQFAYKDALKRCNDTCGLT